MPDTFGSARRPPASTTAVGWIEQEVDDWLHCQIRGKAWMPGEPPKHPVLIRKAELLRRVPLSSVTIWKMEQQGRFPKRVRLTAYDPPIE